MSTNSADIDIVINKGELDDSSPELDLKVWSPVPRPYLILDVRDAELYSRSHISLAVSYPSMR